MAYVAKQDLRYSDQFFIVPRKIAEGVFNMIFNAKKLSMIQCDQSQPKRVYLVKNYDASFQNIHFEETFLVLFNQVAKQAQVNVHLVFFPRILSRLKIELDVKEGEKVVGGGHLGDKVRQSFLKFFCVVKTSSFTIRFIESLQCLRFMSFLPMEVCKEYTAS